MSGSGSTALWREAVGRPEYRLEDVKGEILKLVIAGDDIRELEALGREVFSGEEYKFAFASRHFTEVVSSRAGKDAAMKKLAEIMEIPVGEFFAAGDSMTDLPMLKLAGTSFAPEDAMEAVKACCGHIVPSPVHGEECRRHLLWSWERNKQKRPLRAFLYWKLNGRGSLSYSGSRGEKMRAAKNNPAAEKRECSGLARYL